MAATSCGPAAAQAVSPGIYGNVRLSEVSGDLGGAELELIGTGEEARVEFVLCEGWCNDIVRRPVTLTPEGFKFDYTERLFDETGEPVSGSTNHVEVRSMGEHVTITITPSGTTGMSFGFVLEPIQSRFGLDVAASAED